MMKINKIKKILGWYYDIGDNQFFYSALGLPTLVDLFLNREIYTKYPFIYQISALIGGLLLLNGFYYLYKFKEKKFGKFLKGIFFVLVVSNFILYLRLIVSSMLNHNFMVLVKYAAEYYHIGFLPFVYFFASKINSLAMRIVLFLLPIGLYVYFFFFT